MSDKKQGSSSKFAGYTDSMKPVGTGGVGSGHRRSIKTVLQDSWIDKTYHDIVFVVGEEKERISCHKFIVRLRSKYFHDKITHGYIEGGESVILPKVNANLFRKMIEFMYTDMLDASYTDVKDLRMMAVTYQVSGLAHLLKSESLFQDDLSERNAVSLYQIAQVLEEDTFRDQAWDYIAENIKTVSRAADFLNFTSDNLYKLLIREDLDIAEVELFKNVIKWGKAECDRQKLKLDKEDENLKRVLGRALNLSRFAAIPNDVALGLIAERTIVQSTIYRLRGMLETEDIDMAELKILDADTAMTYLRVAVNSGDEEFVDQVFQYIERNAHKICFNDTFVHLSFEHLKRLLKSNDLRIFSEVDLFRAIKRWVAHKCRRGDVKFTPRYMREMLGGTLKHIRFTQMSIEEFSFHVIDRCTGLLTSEEITSIVRFIRYSPEDKVNHASEMKFATEGRKGYTVHTIMFLPKEPTDEVYVSFEPPLTHTSGFPQFFSSTKNEIETTHFWKALIANYPIAVVSFGFYGPREDKCTIEVVVSLREMEDSDVFEGSGGKLIAKYSETLHEVPKNKIFYVKFEQPVQLKAQTAYVVGFSIKGAFTGAYRVVDTDRSLFLPRKVSALHKTDIRLISSNNNAKVHVPQKGKKDLICFQLPEMQFIL